MPVDVFCIDLEQPIAVVDELRGTLDVDETRAAAARRDDAARHRYVVAHGALRSVLGARLDVAPAAVVITRRCRRCGDPAHGRPALAGTSDVSFSLSHSGSVAVVAVAEGARIGIDVEVERRRARLEALAARVLSPEVHADWLDLDPALRLRAFLEQWTAKEAYLKAIGAGITVPLRDIGVEPDGWTVHTVASPPGTVVSVAVEGAANVRVHDWLAPVPPVPANGSRPIDKFRGTAVGAVFAAVLLGLRDALEPPKDEETAVVQDYAGDPPFQDPIVLRLDPDHPEDSIVMVRTWMRKPASPDARGASGDESGAGD